MALGDTPYYSLQFNNFDTDSLNIISNSGSFYVYWALIPTGTLSSAAINQVAVCFRRYERARKIGAYFMINNKMKFMMQANQKLFLETYTDMWVMVYF